MLGISARSSAAMNIMILTVQKAANGLIRDFGELEKLQASAKVFGDFVSRADRYARQLLLDELSKARPEYDILIRGQGEITASQPRSKFDQNGGYRWLIDPLDGAVNYLHGIPHFSVSVAIDHHEEVIAGVVYNPVTNELYWGEKGRGAYLNNRRIRVSGHRVLGEAIIGTGGAYGYSGVEDGAVRLNNVSRRVGALRQLGATSLDLAFVASGRLDAFFEAEAMIWDAAAGMIIVREAGGAVARWRKGIVASNLCFHEEIKKML
ncbi:MAG: inositol monophosphatase [Holosporales bacterium]|jgi:myo-inositol-1(or 4)-monophosphatase|nr:inositol monophosphatase [Holosporales bacterium]